MEEIIKIILDCKKENGRYLFTIKSLVYVSTTNIYLEYIGYMFRPVNRSSSDLQQNKSKVLFKNRDPNIFTIVDIIKSGSYIIQLKQ